MISDEVAKKLLQNPSFQEFQHYALEKMNELDSLSDLGDIRDEEVAEIVRARALALEVIESIFSPLLGYREKQSVSKEEREKVAKKFGLG